MAELIRFSDIPDKGHDNLRKREKTRTQASINLVIFPVLGTTSAFFFFVAMANLTLGPPAGFWMTILMIYYFIMGGAGTVYFFSESAGLAGELIDSRDPAKCLPSGSTIEKAEAEGKLLEEAKRVNIAICEAQEAILACEEGGLPPTRKLAQQCDAILRMKEDVETRILELKNS